MISQIHKSIREASIYNFGEIKSTDFYRKQIQLIWYRVRFSKESYWQHNAIFLTQEDARFWISNFYLMAIARDNGEVYEDDELIAIIEEVTLNIEKVK